MEEEKEKRSVTLNDLRHNVNFGCSGLQEAATRRNWAFPGKQRDTKKLRNITVAMYSCHRGVGGRDSQHGNTEA